RSAAVDAVNSVHAAHFITRPCAHDSLYAYRKPKLGAAPLKTRRYHVRVGVFTALLAHLSLDDVLKQLKSLTISTVELGTGNYPGDPHCKLSMLDNNSELIEFKKKLSDDGFTISALSCHGNPLHPNPET